MSVSVRSVSRFVRGWRAFKFWDAATGDVVRRERIHPAVAARVREYEAEIEKIKSGAPVSAAASPDGSSFYAENVTEIRESACKLELTVDVELEKGAAAARRRASHL